MKSRMMDGSWAPPRSDFYGYPIAGGRLRSTGHGADGFLGYPIVAYWRSSFLSFSINLGVRATLYSFDLTPCILLRLPTFKFFPTLVYFFSSLLVLVRKTQLLNPFTYHFHRVFRISNVVTLSVLGSILHSSSTCDQTSMMTSEVREQTAKGICLVNVMADVCL